MIKICKSYLIYYAENKNNEVQGQVTYDSMKCVRIQAIFDVVW